MPRKIVSDNLRIVNNPEIKISEVYFPKDWAVKVGCSYEWVKKQILENMCEVVKLGNYYLVVDSEFNRNVFTSKRKK